MAFPHPGSPVAGQPVALPPSPVQPPPLAGYGCLMVDINAGIERLPPGVRAWLRVGRHKVPGALGPGRWYLPVVAGRHRVKVADVTGFPLVSTELAVQEGATHQLHFDFGRWRYRVRDGVGRDVTRFGLPSMYSLTGLILAVIAVLCGCLYALIQATSLLADRLD